MARQWIEAESIGSSPARGRRARKLVRLEPLSLRELSGSHAFSLVLSQLVGDHLAPGLSERRTTGPAASSDRRPRPAKIYHSAPIPAFDPSSFLFTSATTRPPKKGRSVRYTDARYTPTSFDQDAQTRLRLFLSLVVSGNTVFKMSTKIRAFELQSKCVSLRPLRKEGDLGELSEREMWGNTSRRGSGDSGEMGD